MEKKSKKTIIIGITSLFLVTLILIGLTYAYYRTRIIGNDAETSISVQSKKLEVEYSDGNASVNIGDKVEPSNDITYTKTFTVTNNGDGVAYYSVIIDNMTNTFERNEDWEYVLTNNVNSTKHEGHLASGSHQILIPKEELASDAITYTLTLKYINSEEDQSKDMGSTLSFRVNISDEATTWDNSEPTWLASGSQTLINAIKTNTTYVAPENLGVTESTTVPGKTESLEAEAIISSIEDDYGTSYYYRGNIENNYVNYSGMCWRIVRIQGDGTIKLALADEDYECNETGALASSITAYVADPAYNQFQYSMADFVAVETFTHYYDESDRDRIFNMLRITLEAWMNGGTAYDSATQNMLNFEKLNDTSKLVETDWCHNEAIVDINSSKISFDSYYRLSNEDASLRVPKIKCNTKGQKGPVVNALPDGSYELQTKSVRVYDNIGTLTADELALAGAVYHDFNTNSTHYLIDNASGLGMMTMTPSYINKNNLFSAIIALSDLNVGTKPGALMSIRVDDKAAIRPVIALRSDVVLDTNITGQNGTAANPYVIG